MKHSWQFAWAAACLLCTALCSVASPPQKSVLLFYDTRSDMQGNIVVDQAIRSVLNSEFNVDLDVHSEFFEAMGVGKSDYPVLLSWLHRKYAGISFDVVVPVGQNSLAFVREYQRDLFTNARIVFWGRKTALDDWSGPPITGVVAMRVQSKFKVAFSVIRELQPDLQRLIVISGTAEVDRNWETAARDDLHPFEDRITIEYLAGVSLEALQARVTKLPEKTAILFLSMNQDGIGRQLF